MTLIPVSVFDSSDCTAPLCPREADGADGLCPDHRRELYGRAIDRHAAARKPAPAPPKEEPPVPPEKLTREEVIESARAFQREHGRLPRSSDWVKPAASRGPYPSYYQVKSTLGGWPQLLEAAFDIKPSDGQKRSTAAARTPRKLAAVDLDAVMDDIDDLLPPASAEDNDADPGSSCCEYWPECSHVLGALEQLVELATRIEAIEGEISTLTRERAVAATRIRQILEAA